MSEVFDAARFQDAVIACFELRDEHGTAAAYVARFTEAEVSGAGAGAFFASSPPAHRMAGALSHTHCLSTTTGVCGLCC